MEELYDVRSKAAHRGHHQQRQWGWSLPEHLLMAAFVFPLTVKLLLQHDGHYQWKSPLASCAWSRLPEVLDHHQVLSVVDQASIHDCLAVR
jgi:hypothetical protein